MSSHKIARLGIGYVPQGRRLFPSLSVDEHLRMVAGRNGGDRWTPTRVYELFPRLAERKRNGGAQLSGGEQQMLAIGRALMLNPKLLIMDEPSEGLAPAIIEMLIETFRKLEEEGLRILLIEQNLGVATSLAERQLVMVGGEIAAETTASGARRRPGAPAALPRRRAGRALMARRRGRPGRARGAARRGLRRVVPAEGAAGARLRQRQGRRLRDLRRGRRREARVPADRSTRRTRRRPKGSSCRTSRHWSPTARRSPSPRNRDGTHAHLRDERRRHGHAAGDRTRKHSDDHPSWSADGQLDRLRARGGAVPRAVDGRRGDTGVGKGFGSAADPAYSPDGKLIAYDYRRPGYSIKEIYVMNADGTGIRRLTDLRRRQRVPRVVAGRQDAGVPEQRLRRPQRDLHGAASPAGRRSGSRCRTIDAIQPAWTPDGSAITFARDGAIVTITRRQGEEADLGQEQRLGACLAARPAAVGSARHGDRRPPRHARHEGEGVRLPARPAARAGRGRRARRRRACSSRWPRPTSRRTRSRRPPAPTRGAARRRTTAARPSRRCAAARPSSPRGCTRRADSTGSSPSAGRATRRSAPRRCARCRSASRS